MADPGTIALAGMGLAAAGGVVGAIGAENKGAADTSMFQFRAGVANLNRQISLQNADYARAAGEVEAQESGMKTRFIMGQTKAAQGASNLDVNTGTAAAVRDSEYAVGAEDQAIIRSNAAKRAYGFEVEAAESGLQSQADLQAGKYAKSAADVSALSSILGGASSVASKWYQYSSTFGSDSNFDSGNAWVQAGQGQGPWAAG